MHAACCRNAARFVTPPLFNAATPADFKVIVAGKLMSRLKWTDEQLTGKNYLMGEHFSVADPYLFTVTN